LYRTGNSFSIAIYCGGLAVESLLRAFRWREDSSFEGRHDLHELLKASRMFQFDDDFMRRKGMSDEEIQRSQIELRAAMNEVAVLWNNNLRFCSEDSALAHLKRIGKVRGIMEPLKKNALDLLEAAQKVINRGVTLWLSKKKS
jgi:hypothetical protein